MTASMAATPGTNRSGWLVVVAGTALACFWGYWGAVENFHEGWYYPSVGDNLALWLRQYLWLTLVFQGCTLLAIRSPRLGALAFASLALAGWWRFRGIGSWVLFGSIVVPLVALAVLALRSRFGRHRIRRFVAVVIGMPALVIVAASAGPAWRVWHRLDDGIRSERAIATPGFTLHWAPAGPGWPTEGVTWHEADSIARHLAPDGRSVLATPQHAWRLPTVAELVASLVEGGGTVGGTWDPVRRVARFDRTPDKESPLWATDSKVIYWWSATRADSGRAFRVSYNGHVLAVPTIVRWGYLGFRAVRDTAGPITPLHPAPR